MLLVCLILVLMSSVCCDGNNAYTQADLSTFVKNRSFVFISGWPQSGTSFLHQVFTLNPQISSMVENCEKILGKRCINWNHEGQWLIPGSTRNMLNSGVMCPHDGNITEADAYALLSEWKPYWAADKVYLVEKSPHSMLKIPLLRRVFAEAISTKFIILMKHPVTLNVATPRGFSWLNADEKATALSMKDRSPSKKLSFAQTYDVMQFFLDLMRHDNSTLFDHRSPRCSMGWLPTMTALTKQLAADPHSPRDVRIVRFESFQAPLQVCLNLFQFVFGFQSNSTDKLCNRYFAPAQRTSIVSSGGATASTISSATMAQLPFASNSKGNKRASSRLDTNNFANHNSVNKAGKPLQLLPGQTGRATKMPPGPANSNTRVAGTDRIEKGRVLHTTEANANNGSTTVGTTAAVSVTDERLESSLPSSAATRQLRLRSSQESAETFSFIPALVSERGRLRVREFVTAYHMVGPSMKAKLDAVNKQLKPFGYSLFQWPAIDADTSLFSKWDIAEQYPSTT